MKKEREANIQAKTNINVDEKQVAITVNSSRVLKMLFYGISVVIFLVGLLHFVFRIYILGIAFTIVAFGCFIYVKILINKFEKEATEQGYNIENRSLKEDSIEYVKILKDIFKLSGKSIFKVMRVIVCFYIIVLLIVVILMTFVGILLK